MATRNVVPRANNEGGIGTVLKNWASGFIKIFVCDSITVGSLSGFVKAAAGVLSAAALASGDIPSNAANTSGTAGNLSGPAETSNTRKFLRELSVAGVFQTPAWDTLQAADIPNLDQSLGVGGVFNFKPVVNATVNKLDVFTKSGGAVPDTSNPIAVMVPDGNGYTRRTRAAAYLSGTSQFILADAANYWLKGSLDAEIKSAYVYAIWDAAGGIVWALGGYSGFTRVPASTTATDDDFFLLEASSTYTKVITDYCVCVGKIRYQYDTADTPDHTIQATVEDAPQVVWNPKSDYRKFASLAVTVVQESQIADYSAASFIVKQSGLYLLGGTVTGGTTLTSIDIQGLIKAGSSTYTDATVHMSGRLHSFASADYCCVTIPSVIAYLNIGNTVHIGAKVDGGGTRILYGDSNVAKATFIMAMRID